MGCSPDSVPRFRPPTADDVDDTDAADAEPDAEPDVVAGEETPFTRRDEALVPLIVSGARKLKRVLADEQNGVLDTLRRAEPVTTLDDLLPSLDEHLGVYVEALADELIGAAAAGATEAGVNDTKTLRRTLPKAGALEAAHALVRSDLVAPAA